MTGVQEMVVVVASQNPVKKEATKQGFEAMFTSHSFTFVSQESDSGVSSQPLSDAETILGARNRVCDIRRRHPAADFYVGIEGGVEDIDGELHEFAWVVIENATRKTGKGRSAVFIAPPEIRRLILEEKKELGDAGDIVFGQENCKQKTGVVGMLTNGVVDRVELYRHPVVMALAPFVHGARYSA